MDLRTSYLGLDLRSPLVASASPLTGDLDGLRRLEQAGAAAVVLPSLFEEQITHELVEIDRFFSVGLEPLPEATAYPAKLDDYNTGLWSYLALAEKASRTIGIPVIGSLNGVTTGGWVRHATRLEEAGVAAIELNLYDVATDPAVGGVELEARYLDVVAAVRAAVRVPVAVKLSPYFTAVANMAVRLVDAGADGLVLFNRFYQPDLDLDALDVRPRLVLSTSDELRLPLRWTAILYGRVRASLAVTTGVHTGKDAAKALLAGADVVMMASALLRGGPERLREVEHELVVCLAGRDLTALAEVRGRLSQLSAPDPTGYERAHYMRTLLSYAPPEPGRSAAGAEPLLLDATPPQADREVPDHQSEGGS
jgi:dihydroorotate dehydrogenase (fumarate)